MQKHSASTTKKHLSKSPGKYKQRVSQVIAAEQLIEQGTNADVKKYLFLLYASAASLLGFVGYTTESIYDAVRGYNHRSLFDYSAKK